MSPFANPTAGQAKTEAADGTELPSRVPDVRRIPLSRLAREHAAGTRAPAHAPGVPVAAFNSSL